MYSAGLTLTTSSAPPATVAERTTWRGRGRELIPPIVRRGLRGGVTYSDGVETTPATASRWR